MGFRLCYVNNNILYFTDNFEHQRGNGWSKSSYEHNAGMPYELYDELEYVKDKCGHIRYFAFLTDWRIKQLCEGHFNSPYSVEAINNGAIAWLFCKEAGGLMAGATIEEAIKWFEKANIKWGELK